MSKEGKYPFQNIEHLFTSKDVAVANLKVVLTKRGVLLKKRPVLRTNPENMNFLCKIGFDLVNIANNHIFDYGIEGYRDTLNALEKTSLKYIRCLRERQKYSLNY